MTARQSWRSCKGFLSLFWGQSLLVVAILFATKRRIWSHFNNLKELKELKEIPKIIPHSLFKHWVECNSKYFPRSVDYEDRSTETLPWPRPCVGIKLKLRLKFTFSRTATILLRRSFQKSISDQPKWPYRPYEKINQMLAYKWLQASDLGQRSCALATCGSDNRSTNSFWLEKNIWRAAAAVGDNVWSDPLESSPIPSCL